MCAYIHRPVERNALGFAIGEARCSLVYFALAELFVTVMPGARLRCVCGYPVRIVAMKSILQLVDHAVAVQWRVRRTSASTRKSSTAKPMI